jgi:hypothetical protein
MFIGHYALGFGAKRVAPSVSLGVLFLACQLADLVWPNLVLTGVEVLAIDPGNTAFTPLNFVSYPYSHSLVALALWAVVAAGLYAVVRRSTTTAVVTVGALVLSHWVLDVVSHRPDMPITIGGSTKIGFGLWQSVPATMIVEGALFAAGVWIYARVTEARDRTGTLALWGLVAFFVVVYLANVFGPPPPSPAAVAWSAQAMWLLVAWGYWVDRHRRTTAAPG